MDQPSGKLWGGRFSADLDDLALAYSESIDADAPMVAEDIWGSEGHGLMLARCGILSEEDLREILRWLEHAREEWEAGRLTLLREREDVHMNVEFYLREHAGAEMGGRLHTARSRNDQVVTDCRMHLRARLLDVQQAVADLQGVLLDLAAPNTETVMPGYTHTQQAQPISVGFWLSGHVAALARDQQRLGQLYARVNRCPLGAAALAGTSFPTDRRLSAALLGFDGVEEHALDAVGSRDFVMEALADLAILGVALSRLAEEIVIFSTYEFGMVEVSDAHASGSSIMPQKKNPCLAELARGRTGRLIGRLVQSLTTFKGLISGYNRDLQEDKPPLWEALEVAESGAKMLAATMHDATLKTARMRELVGQNFATATELANYLVRDRGLPFRTCHEIIGALVGQLVKEEKTLDDHARVQELLAAAGQNLTLEEIAAVVEPEACLRLQVSLGSTGPAETAKLIAALQTERELSLAQVAERRERIAAAREHTAKLVEGVLKGTLLSDLEWPEAVDAISLLALAYMARSQPQARRDLDWVIRRYVREYELFVRQAWEEQSPATHPPSFSDDDLKLICTEVWTASQDWLSGNTSGAVPEGSRDLARQFTCIIFNETQEACRDRLMALLSELHLDAKMRDAVQAVFEKMARDQGLND